MSISKALNSLGFWNEVDPQNEITDFKLENNGDGKGVVIVWLSDKTQPSDAAIKEADDALQAEYDSLAYSRSRANEYPKIEELVVALYDTDDKAALEKRRSDVKKRFPKT